MQSAQILACSKVITMHALNSKQPINTYTPHKGLINCVHINHSNKVIASSGQDGRIILVNAQKTDNVVFDARFNENTSNPSGSSSAKTISITNSSTTGTIPPSVNAIMFSSNSYYIAAGASDSLIKIWDMKNHKSVFSTLKTHVAPISSLAWIKYHNIQKLQGGSELLASSSTIGDIFIHNVKTSNIVQTFNSKNQQAINQIKVSQSQGHCRLAACTSTGSVLVWDIRNISKSNQPFCHFNNGKKSSITSVSFSSFNPVLLAAASVDQNLTFYDIHDKKPVKVIPSEEPLTSINFHNDGHTLVSGGMYGGLFVYDLRKPNKIKERLIGHQTAIKHTEFIKQYEQQSSGGMAMSRSSKASSSVNGGTKSVASNSTVEGGGKTHQIQPVNSGSRSKSIKGQIAGTGTGTVTGTTTGTTTGAGINNILSTTSSGSLGSMTNISSGVGKVTTVGGVGTTGGISQPMVNNYTTTGQITRSGVTTSPISPISTITSTNNANNNNSKYSASQQQTASLSTSGQQALQQQQYKPYQQLYSAAGNINSNSVSNKYIPTSTTIPSPMSTDVKEFIEQKIQNLHMQIIHQFHEQQRQTKKMIEDMLVRSNQKDKEIERLKTQLKKLYTRTY